MRDGGWGKGTRVDSDAFAFPDSLFPCLSRHERFAQTPFGFPLRTLSAALFHPMGDHSHRDLRVWNIAVQLTLEVYRITESFPRSEQFGLTSQMRRAAVSVASNIAEGHARSTRGEFRHFLSIARGSAIEVEVQLFLAEQIGYVQSPTVVKARGYCESISRMITKLKRAL